MKHPAAQKVFVCQSVFVAFIDKTHLRYPFAQAYFRHFAETNYHVFTNSDTMMKTYQVIHDHMSPLIANEFIKALVWGAVSIIEPTESELKEALKLLQNKKDQKLIFSEALISTVSHKRNIQEIATFDQFQPTFGQNIFSLPR